MVRVPGPGHADAVAEVGQAGNWAPAEYPPEEDEYSVVATVLVPLITMTWFAVSAVAEAEASVSSAMPG